MKRKKRKKLWSVPRIKHPKFPARKVRVGEFKAGGTLYVFWWEGEKQRSESLKRRRVDLGATAAAQEAKANELGAEVIEKLAARDNSPRSADRSGPLTLGTLLARYERDGLYKASPYYRRDALACVRRVAEFIGAGLLVTDLRPSHAERYLAHRIKGGHAPAGRRDLVAVSIACNWAAGEGLLALNPLSSVPAKKAMSITHQPSRPFATKEEYEALLAYARGEDAPPQLKALLALAWHTGHRIGAILALRWKDVTLTPLPNAEFGAITWYAGVVRNKKKHEHTVDLNREAHAMLTEWRNEQPTISAGACVFPCSVDAQRPIDASKVRRWLREAIDKSGVPSRPQGGWHMFRRGWATARKHLSVKDVMASGGWTEESTLLKCYQHATAEGTRTAAQFVA